MKIKKVIYEYETKDECYAHEKEMYINGYRWVHMCVDRNESGRTVWIAEYENYHNS